KQDTGEWYGPQERHGIARQAMLGSSVSAFRNDQPTRNKHGHPHHKSHRLPSPVRVVSARLNRQVPSREAESYGMRRIEAFSRGDQHPLPLAAKALRS